MKLFSTILDLLRRSQVYINTQLQILERVGSYNIFFEPVTLFDSNLGEVVLWWNHSYTLLLPQRANHIQGLKNRQPGLYYVGLVSDLSDKNEIEIKFNMIYKSPVHL